MHDADTLAPDRLAHDADTLAPGRLAHDADTLAPGQLDRHADSPRTIDHYADTLAPSSVDPGADTLAPPPRIDAEAPTLAALGPIDDEAPTLTPARTPRPPARGRSEEPALGEVIGRYVILAHLGAGGMGVVYAAYDPELDRKIALKLLRDPRGGAEARARLVREAQAMAQLAHPNVVAVHDVGTVGDRVYVAMEFVAGETLTEWLERSRSWKEIVRVILAAGDGLQAAHAAGLIHRDFKPDNVMVGDDGRARVMDFGLARAGLPSPSADGVTPARGDGPTRDRATRDGAIRGDSLTQAGAVMGTPRYMAPEQWEGAETDARTDQFALCVTLWEALFGAPPFAGDTFFELSYAVLNGERRPPPAGAKVPAWLRRVIDRGLQPRPADRWPTTEALLAALRDDPTPRRRWWAAGATLALGVGVALVGARVDRMREVRACGVRATAIDATWSEPARAAIREGMLRSGAPFVERALSSTTSILDGLADEWQEAERSSCLATHVDETVSPEVGERQEACLDERRAEIAALVDLLKEPDAGVIASVTAFVSQLRRPATCLDVERLGTPSTMDPGERAKAQELRRRFARLQVLTAMARLDEAQTLADEVWREADALGVAELRARARILATDVAGERGDHARARAAAEEALLIAGRGHADELAAFAADDLAVIVGVTLHRPEEGLAYSRLAEMWLDRAGVGDDLQRARALVIRGALETETGDFERAEADLREGIAIRERLSGANSISTAAAYEVLSNALRQHGDIKGSAELFDRTLAIREAILGADHPDVGIALSNRAIGALARGDYHKALADMRRALAITEATVDPDHLNLASLHNNLGRALAATGQLDEAAQHFQRVVEIDEKNLGEGHHEIAFGLNGLGDVALRRGDFAGAQAFHGRALALREAALGADHPYIAYSATGLAEALVCAGDPREATPLLERALRLGREYGDQEIITRASRALADALSAADGDPEEIAALRAAAGDAASACPPAGGAATETAG
ncbi:MAG: serine/threonine protein kinase [Myxococcales bacterium]|nr:serine/threonine protein kinase [Myxococcales bacterium]